MFIVTITEKKNVKQIKSNVWGVLRTEEEKRNIDFYRSDEKEPKTRIVDVMGYLPEQEVEVEVKTDLFTQTVETLDVSKVIKAINNL